MLTKMRIIIFQLNSINYIEYQLSINTKPYGQINISQAHYEQKLKYLQSQPYQSRQPSNHQDVDVRSFKKQEKLKIAQLGNYSIIPNSFKTRKSLFKFSLCTSTTPDDYNGSIQINNTKNQQIKNSKPSASFYHQHRRIMVGWRNSIDLNQPIQQNKQKQIPKKSTKKYILSKSLHNKQSNFKQQPKYQKKIRISNEKEIYKKPFYPPSNITAYSYIIYQPQNNLSNYQSQQIQFKKISLSQKIYSAVEIASLTKIMTCILAIQLCQKFQLKVSKQLLKVGKFQCQVEGTSANLSEGQIYTLQQLLYGLMLPSGNDASLGIAVWGGLLLLKKQNNSLQTIISKKGIKSKYTKKQCYKRFILQMNIKAKQLNLKKTKYANPHGLINSNNKSCCYDLAVLCQYSINNKLFAEIVKTSHYQSFIKVKKNNQYKRNKLDKQYDIENNFDNEQQLTQSSSDNQESNNSLIIQNQYKSKKISWQNTHKLLKQKPQQYIGIKTGFTSKAGGCLASLIQINKKSKKIIIVLGCNKQELRFKQTQILKKWVVNQQQIGFLNNKQKKYFIQ